jgi:hypothetical protein
VAKLDDLFPERQGSVLRGAVQAATGALRDGLPADLGVTPFTAFVTVDGKFAGNGSTGAGERGGVGGGDEAHAARAADPPPRPPAAERQLFPLFQAGLPPEKQASWLLYNLLPVAATAEALGRARRAPTRLTAATGSPDFDLRFEPPPGNAPGGKVVVKDRLGQRLRILSSAPVCAGWVHTVDGVLWPGARAAAAAAPDPVKGGTSPAAPAPAPSGGLRPVAFAADAVALPPALAGRGAPAADDATANPNPNAIASTAFAATGAAISAAVSTIQSSIAAGAGGNNETGAGGGGSVASAAAPTPSSSAAPPLSGSPVDATDKSTVVVGAVLGGAAGLLACGAAAAAALIYRRRRRLGSRGASGGLESDVEDGASDGASEAEGGSGAKALIARVLGGGSRGAKSGGGSAARPDSAADRGGTPPLGAAWPPSPREPAAGTTPLACGGAECWAMRPDDVEICLDPAGNRWQLGVGGFGAVYKGRYQGSTDVAVKLVTGHSPKEVARFANEVTILQALRHTNVVQFLGASLEEDAATGGRVMLVTEYLPRGDLWRALSKDAAHVFSWYRRGRAVALDVVRGLAFMHSKKVMHLDLKSANILLGRDGTAKVADVGLAKILTRDATHVSMEGTFDWAAPEVLAGQGVSESADIYSLGVVLWEIVTGERPHMRQMRAVRVPAECPREVADVIEACRQVDPSARPTARAVYAALAAAPAAAPAGGAGDRGDEGAVPARVSAGGGSTAAAASPFENAALSPAASGGAASLGTPGTPAGVGARRGGGGGGGGADSRPLSAAP